MIRDFLVCVGIITVFYFILRVAIYIRKKLKYVFLVFIMRLQYKYYMNYIKKRGWVPKKFMSLSNDKEFIDPDHWVNPNYENGKEYTLYGAYRIIKDNINA